MKIVEVGRENLACGELRSAAGDRDEETKFLPEVAVVSESRDVFVLRSAYGVLRSAAGGRDEETDSSSPEADMKMVSEPQAAQANPSASSG